MGNRSPAHFDKDITTQGLLERPGNKSYQAAVGGETQHILNQSHLEGAGWRRRRQNAAHTGKDIMIQGLFDTRRENR